MYIYKHWELGTYSISYYSVISSIKINKVNFFLFTIIIFRAAFKSKSMYVFKFLLGSLTE